MDVDPGFDPLRHHGDVEASADLVDFAVNVRAAAPPRWLRDRLVAALDDVARYPATAHDEAARVAAGERHGRDPRQVLVLSGVSEGFALLPALRPRHAVVVHPSYTEPEAALRAAGARLTRVHTGPDHRLDPATVPDDADLVVLGNPTNPTSVLHPAAAVRQLARPGRTVVVDEAFMDAVPGEAESVAADDTTPGLLVMRSLTKTWALAGLRAGYALGAPELLARLAAPRSAWPVSSLALTAVQACCEAPAVSEAAAEARQLAEHRELMADRLAELPGVSVHRPATAPFLLLTVRDGALVRERLREVGIAVRRGDTFPGLTPDHLRVAVREPVVVDELVKALGVVLNGTLGQPRCRKVPFRTDVPEVWT